MTEKQYVVPNENEFKRLFLLKVNFYRDVLCLLVARIIVEITNVVHIKMKEISLAVRMQGMAFYTYKYIDVRCYENATPSLIEIGRK